MMPKQITSLLHVLCLVVWWKWFLFSWKGLRPCESNETKCTFPMGRCLDQTCWSASYKIHQPKCISISVFPPSNVCIGRYILNMQITSCGHTYQRCLGDFYVLFNPWCAGKSSSDNQTVLRKIASDEWSCWKYLLFSWYVKDVVTETMRIKERFNFVIFL